MKEEISKSQNVDYSLIEERSLLILKTKCKDIRVFLYLALCYLKNRNWEHFTDVFCALEQLGNKNFESLFPVRPKGKELALKWLDESRFADTLEGVVVSADAHEHIKRLVDSLQRFKILLEKKFPDNTPFPSKLFAAVLKWEKATEPKKEVKPVISENVVQQAVESTTISSSSPLQTTGVYHQSTDALKPLTISDTFDTIRKCSLHLITSEPDKAVGYRLLRAVRWAAIYALPVADNSITKIEPPVQLQTTYLQSLLDKGEYKTALLNSEKSFSSGTTIYLFDLQRISATAAGFLGRSYDAVREAIILEMAIFLKRFPKITELSFVDETPFCSFETLQWIEKEVMPTFSTKEVLSQIQENGDSLLKEKQDAFALIASNQVDAAIDFLTEKIKQSGVEQDNFKRRLYIASCMLNARRADIALHILESLYDKANSFNLSVWDPSLFAEVLNLLLSAYESVSKGLQGAALDLVLDKKTQIVKKLSYIDPKKVFKFKPLIER